MGLLGTLILNEVQKEVQKKTCVTLSPDMREFLGWMLEVDREEEPLEEVHNFRLHINYIAFVIRF